MSVSQLHVSLPFVECVVHSPDGSATLVEFHSHKTLVQREVVSDGILQSTATDHVTSTGHSDRL